MIFAYLGPPDRKPAFPVYDVLEDLGEDEFVLADDKSLGGGGPEVLDFNWLLHWENVVDPFHVPILHARFSGNQFVPERGILPEVTFTYTSQGVRASSTRDLPDGRVLFRIAEVVFPNIRLVASPKLNSTGPANIIGWVVPFDDTHFKVFSLIRTPQTDAVKNERSRLAGGKLWEELTPAEHQKYPGDYEAQMSQGPLPAHSLEFLTTTDQGVAMLRRMMGKQIKAVTEGQDPAGVTLEGDTVAYRVEAGNYFRPGQPTAAAPSATDR
jgi:phenylpropionate dioxygenase-like ring-hydroxylating dioxygenase large terminal subunit